MTGDTLLAAGKTQFFCGGGFYIYMVDCTAEISGQIEAHIMQMGCHFWALGNNGYICISQCIALCSHHSHNSGQQIATVAIFVGRVGVGKVLTNITQSKGTQQAINQGVNKYIPIGMSNKSPLIGNTDSPQYKSTALAKSVDIVTMTYAH
jgi:hypothetical protein